jgi:class 3 adenylate cyclase
MSNETQHGYLVLADISGYTSYLVGTELTHARDVLTELLELIVQRFKPTLEIVKLEGDAVFAYVSKNKIARDELLLEVQESTYVAFRDRVEGIRRRTTCQCNACKAIPNLDLKFIVHFGEYILQNVSGIRELVGSDVNLVHRLLKNQVSGMTGWKAYLLFTEAALAQMNLKLENLHELVEFYEHLGNIKTYSLDLHARYKELVEARRVLISPEDADWTLIRTFAAQPEIVWDWLNDPQKRLLWESFDDIRPIVRPRGRLGAGASNHCAHGKNIVVETIVDWHPFEHFTLNYPFGARHNHLEPVSNGTRLNIYTKLKAPLPRRLNRILAWLMAKMTKAAQGYDHLVRLIEKDADTSRKVTDE